MHNKFYQCSNPINSDSDPILIVLYQILIFTLNAYSGVANGPAAVGSDGTIYFGSNSGILYAVNRDGTQKWAYQTGSVY